MAQPERTTVQGSVIFASNDLQIAPGVPALSRVRGTVSFSERGFTLAGMQARALGGDLRLGIFDMDGTGEVVGGIVVMRYGENANNVIEAVKKKMTEYIHVHKQNVEYCPATYKMVEKMQDLIG